MTTLGQVIKALGNTLQSDNPSGQVVYYCILDKNDNTTFPIFEIDVIKEIRNDFAISTFSTYTVQLLIYVISNTDKHSIDNLEEKSALNQSVRSSIIKWYNSIKASISGIGTLSNIETGIWRNADDGEFGDLTKNVNWLGIQFNISMIDS